MAKHETSAIVFTRTVPTPISSVEFALDTLCPMAEDLKQQVLEHVAREGDDPDISTLALSVEKRRGGFVLKLSMETK